MNLVWPPPCNRDHQDYYMFSKGFLLTFTFHCYKEGAISNLWTQNFLQKTKKQLLQSDWRRWWRQCWQGGSRSIADRGHLFQDSRKKSVVKNLQKKNCRSFVSKYNILQSVWYLAIFWSRTVWYPIQKPQSTVKNGSYFGNSEWRWRTATLPLRRT